MVTTWAEAPGPYFPWETSRTEEWVNWRNWFDVCYSQRRIMGVRENFCSVTSLLIACTAHCTTVRDLYSLLSSGQSFADNPEVKTDWHVWCDKGEKNNFTEKISNQLWICEFWKKNIVNFEEPYCACVCVLSGIWSLKIIPIKISSLTFNTFHVTES